MEYLKLKGVPWAVSQLHLQEFVLEMCTKMTLVVLGNSSFIEYWPRMHDPEFGSQHPIKLSLVIRTSNPSTWKVEPGGSEVQGCPQLQGCPSPQNKFRPA